MPQKEYPSGPEITEALDPSLEEEQALKDSLEEQQAAQEEMEDTEEGEEEDDDWGKIHIQNILQFFSSQVFICESMDK